MTDPKAPLWEDGPTIAAITREDGTYYVPEEWQERYITKAQALATNRKRLNDAFSMPKQGSVALQTRNFARAVHGVGPFDSVRDMVSGWPSDNIGLPGTFLHFELLDELAREDADAQRHQQWQALRPKCGACREVFDSLAGGLCDECNKARRHVQREQDKAAAEQRIGNRMTGKTRAELVTAWLSN